MGKLLGGLLLVTLLYGCAQQATVEPGDRSTAPTTEGDRTGTAADAESVRPPGPLPTSEPASKPVPAPKPQPEPKPEPRPESVSQSATAPQPEPETEPKTEPKPASARASQPAPAPKLAAASQPRPETKIEPKAEAKPAPADEPKPDTAQIQATPPSAMQPEPEHGAALVLAMVELEKLPLEVNSNWTLDWGHDPISGRTRCFLRSSTLRIEDGQGGSKISLIITGDTLRVDTRSNVDLSYDDTGLQVDSKTPFPLQSLFGETDVLFDQQVEEIMQQFRSGSSVTVTMGFWPTWPVSRTYSVNFAISGYAMASEALQKCDGLVP